MKYKALWFQDLVARTAAIAEAFYNAKTSAQIFTRTTRTINQTDASETKPVGHSFTSTVAIKAQPSSYSAPGHLVVY
jgi:hypothetical protein